MEIDEPTLDQDERVCVSLVFFDFAIDPDEITETLGIEPDEVRRKGEVQIVAGSHEFPAPHSLWVLSSTISSTDPNVQIRGLLDRVRGQMQRIDPAWNPSFNVLWKSKILGAGSGPYYEKDVIEGIAEMGAEIYQDLYLFEDD